VSWKLRQKLTRADPTKKKAASKAASKASYSVDPEKKKAASQASYSADPTKKKAASKAMGSWLLWAFRHM